MGYKYKDGYERKVKPRAFSLRIDTVDRLKEYDEINWSRVVDKLLLNYLDQLDQMENLKVSKSKESSQLDFEAFGRMREARFETYRRLGSACNEALELMEKSQRRELEKEAP